MVIDQTLCGIYWLLPLFLVSFGYHRQNQIAHLNREKHITIKIARSFYLRKTYSDCNCLLGYMDHTDIHNVDSRRCKGTWTHTRYILYSPNTCGTRKSCGNNETRMTNFPKEIIKRNKMLCFALIDGKLMKMASSRLHNIEDGRPSE